MARDRKRAKQRRERRGAAATARREAANGRPEPPPGEVVRSDLPGSLDHAGAEVDEFDAALVSGAGGVPLAPGEEEELTREELESEAELNATEAADEGATPPAGPPAQPPRRPPGGGRGGGGETPSAGGGGELAPERRNAISASGSRAVGFLRASWAELQRVQWPDRRQVFQATAVVIGFVAIAGLYLGLADLVAKEIVEFIL
ncbi:MAG TPA: preprotein translocase subunit SecE [Solirubrobacteraceae bacterium]|nr:preprotein translocase subunit SecE [Solirubrobacteraceae bacterium]